MAAPKDLPRSEAWKELRALVAVAWPVSIALMSRFVVSLTDISVLGHLGTPELSAATLALVWMSITRVPISRGVSSSVNTLASQAIGGGQPALAGLWLRAAVALCVLASLPVMACWQFTATMLRVMDISDNVRGLAQRFATISTIWLLPTMLTFACNAWLQAQHTVTPQLFIYCGFVLVNLALNLVLVYGWDSVGGMGFDGSPTATVATRVAVLLSIALYTTVIRPRRARAALAAATESKPLLNTADSREHSTSGPSPQPAQERAVAADAHRHADPSSVLAALGGLLSCSPPLTWRRWKELLRLVALNTVGGALEEGQLQMVALMAGWLGEAEVAAFTAVVQLYFVLSAAMFGIENALIVRLGHHIGRADKRAAKTAQRMSLVVALALSGAIAVTMVAARNQLPYIFTHDPAVVSRCAESFPLVGACYMAMALFYVCMGTLQAQARPGVVAVAFLIGAWGVCIPTAYLFAFHLGHGLLGLWYGLIIGYGTVTLIAGAAVLRSDWDAILRDAAARNASSPPVSPSRPHGMAAEPGDSKPGLVVHEA